MLGDVHADDADVAVARTTATRSVQHELGVLVAVPVVGLISVALHASASTARTRDCPRSPAAGSQGFKQFFTTMRTAFPDLHVEVEHLVADDENVAFAYCITGTHQGEFQGIGPTGQRVDVRGVQISRFVDGKISERWGSSDEAGILKRLGG